MATASAQNARMGPPAQGLAALSVVMMLFLIMALVAAYTNRNLVFEQRVAANGYRAERALIGGDAAGDWLITLLNSGRVDLSCTPSNNAGDTPPRQRYLVRQADTDGTYTPLTYGTNSPLYPGCVMSNATLTCVCPTAATPEPSPNPTRTWPIGNEGSAFRTRILAPGSTQPGALVLDIRGCGSPGSGADACTAPIANPVVDGVARVRMTLGLVRALQAAPPATLTVGGAVLASTTVLKVANPDANSGLTVQTGGALSAGGASVYAGPAGSGDNGVIANSGPLANLQPTAATAFTSADLFFRSLYGMEAPLYRRQQAVVRITCAAACGTADLQAALNRYPGLTLWFDGDLSIDTAPTGGTLGDATHPVMLIVNGQFSVQAAADILGFVYASRANWTGGASAAVLRGALVVVEDFSADVPVTMVYDAAALKTIEQYYGTFVRAPGGWDRPN